MENKKKPIEYRLAHMGIHTSGPEEAEVAADTLATLFNKKTDDNQIRTFVGNIIEVKKKRGMGEYGHIGIEVDDVDEALEDLKRKGVSAVERTIWKDETGKTAFAYLDKEICGFGIHLQKTGFEGFQPGKK